MNPINIIKNMMGKFASPQQLVQSMIGKNSNPIFQNLIQMASCGNNKGIENFARNICKEKGIDFDKEFKDFVQNFK